jgi:hypothetical protein
MSPGIIVVEPDEPAGTAVDFMLETRQRGLLVIERRSAGCGDNGWSAMRGAAYAATGTLPVVMPTGHRGKTCRRRDDAE